MSMFLDARSVEKLVGGETVKMGCPIPWLIPSNGEFHPPVPTARQRQFRDLYHAFKTSAAAKLGVSQEYLSAANLGMAGAFNAMNSIYPDSFAIGKDETTDPLAADDVRARLKHQFVFDDHVHFLREDADPANFQPFLGMIDWTADALGLQGMKQDVMKRIGFGGFIKDIYLDSDTSVAMLTGAPGDEDHGWLLSNDMIALAKQTVNDAFGSERLLSHAIFAPGRDGWLDEIDRAHSELQPNAWKGYTIGDPFAPSCFKWRMDDQTLVYPAYERMVKAGVTTVCVHKGIVPDNVEEIMPGAEPYARVDDVGQAARDWPQLNFVIYHAAYRTSPQPSLTDIEAFERSGRLDWVSDLAEIPVRYGVSNVYADIGASFAFTVLTHPRLAAGMLGILINGLGADKILWGTDSVWFGSPQWQIEAFRRLKMPADLQERFGFPDLGLANGQLKSAILGLNGARLYNLPSIARQGQGIDKLDSARSSYIAAGGARTNYVYGYIRKEDAGFN